MSGDIQRITPVFWPCCTWCYQMSSIICGVTRQKFTKFLHDIATSSPLLARTFRRWYCNSFLNDSSKNASDTLAPSEQVRYQTKLVAMATSLAKLENEVQIYQDCEYQSSRSGDIRPNTPVFLAMSYQTFTNELCQHLELLDRISRNSNTIYC